MDDARNAYEPREAASVITYEIVSEKFRTVENEGRNGREAWIVSGRGCALLNVNLDVMNERIGLFLSDRISVDNERFGHFRSTWREIEEQNVIEEVVRSKIVDAEECGLTAVNLLTLYSTKRCEQLALYALLYAFVYLNETVIVCKKGGVI